MRRVGDGPCNLSGGNNQPHVVTVTNLETFPVYFDCEGSTSYPMPTPVEFQSNTHPHVSPARWVANQIWVGTAPPANSLMLSHVELVSKFPGTPIVHTTLTGRVASRLMWKIERRSSGISSIAGRD